ncbi:MAG: GNAT family N-acetyltransferase [Pseudonocardiaceae bacterium]
MPGDPVLWLPGERVALGPTHAELIEEYWRWENDPVAVNGYGRQVPESLETRREGYGHQARGSLNQVRFTVHDLKNETAPCGLTSLTVDHQVRTAEFLILLAPESRGRGLAAEATRLTLDYAFHLTALAQVWLKVLEPNAAAIRAYEQAGFQHAGRLRQAGYWYGQRCDELIMDALPTDFPGPSVFTGVSSPSPRSA